jgi:transcriptional regulator with XRE-family HTH domain
VTYFEINGARIIKPFAIGYNQALLVILSLKLGIKMSVHEKIRFVRLAKGWTQEYLAEKLDMSVNGYGDLERGKNDIKLSKLEQISELLGVELSELFSSNEKAVFNFIIGDSNHSFTFQNSELKHELEKRQILIDDKDKEIALLKRIIELMEAKNEVTT